MQSVEHILPASGSQSYSTTTVPASPPVDPSPVEESILPPPVQSPSTQEQPATENRMVTRSLTQILWEPKFALSISV